MSFKYLNIKPEDIKKTGIDNVIFYIYIQNEYNTAKKYNKLIIDNKNNEWFEISIKKVEEELLLNSNKQQYKIKNLKKYIDTKNIKNKRYFRLKENNRAMNINNSQEQAINNNNSNDDRVINNNNSAMNINNRAMNINSTVMNINNSNPANSTGSKPSGDRNNLKQLKTTTNNRGGKPPEEKTVVVDVDSDTEKEKNKNIENVKKKLISKEDISFLSKYCSINNYLINTISKKLNSIQFKININNDNNLSAVLDVINNKLNEINNFIDNFIKDTSTSLNHTHNFLLGRIDRILSDEHFIDDVNKVVKNKATKNNKINELDNNDNLNKKEFYIQLFDIVPLDNSFKKDFIVKLEELRKEDTLSYSELFSIIADVEENSKYFTRDDGFNDIDNEKKIKNLIDLIKGETKYKNIGGVV